MNNPLTWAVPLFRAFAVNVRVHILYFLVTLGLFLREIFRDGAFVSPLDVFLFMVPMLFVVILIHEYGHVFGGRYVGGECEEILIWPLGGLAFVDTPREWRAHTFTALAGPLTNIAQCVLCTIVLLGFGFIPTLNPLDSPYVSPMKNYRDGKTYTSEYGVKLYHTDTGLPHPDYDKKNYAAKVEDAREIARVKEADGYARAVAPVWAVWLNRLFWLNLVLTLLNFIPAYPLDGGQILQGLVWARTDYRQGTVVACISGFVCAMAMFVVSIAVIEPLVIALCFFVLFACWVKWRQLTEGVGEFGYDTERGYSGMDDDEPPARPAKRVGPLKRWLQARAAKKLQREHEQRAKDDERMDQLLEKIARKEPISDEDRRFMQRVSERYRKPQ
ncbi:MAG: site-2 protease family protein [Fimbriiglobus sp.]|nr:site-2 protease family protein [Fimbriiglobus sp.]